VRGAVWTTTGHLPPGLPAFGALFNVTLMGEKREDTVETVCLPSYAPNCLLQHCPLTLTSTALSVPPVPPANAR
jgi:hypothetical protein